MSADLFKKAEDDFLRLMGELKAGCLTLDQFHEALKQSKVTDHLGRSWTIGAKTGKWYFHDGSSWIQADPDSSLRGMHEPDAVSPVTPEPSPESGPGSTIQSPTTQPDSLELLPSNVSPIPSAATSPATQPVALEPSAEIRGAPLAPSPPQPVQTPGLPVATSEPTTQSWLLLVLVLGMCALLCVLSALAVVLAAARGLIGL
jgi:hypothetical protein